MSELIADKENERFEANTADMTQDDQYLKFHKHIASQRGSYEASFILEQTLGPRPETPLLDKVATPEEIK